MVRVQADQLALLRPQGARPFPQAGRDGDPAEVVDEAGPPDKRVGSAVPRWVAACAASPATAREWPWNHGVLRSAASPNPARASSSAASSRNTRAGTGSASTTDCHRSSGSESSSSSSGDSRKFVAIAGSSARPDRSATVSRASSTPPTASNMTAQYPTAANRAASDTSSGSSGRCATTVEPLERVEHRKSHGLRQPQPSGQVRSHFAVGSGAGDDQSRHARGTAQDAELLDAVAEAGEEPHRLRGTCRVGEVAARPDEDVVATECDCHLVRRRRAAGEPQQRPVVDVTERACAEAGLTTELGGDQAGAHRLTGRVAAGEVARDRECCQHPAHPDRLAYRHSRRA